MDNQKLIDYLETELAALKETSMYREEMVINEVEGANIQLRDGMEMLNFCSGDYLSLAESSLLKIGADEAMEEYGCGTSSPRCISGTRSIHRVLEQCVARFFGMQDAILFASQIDAESSIFETFLGKEDAVLSDEYNHASLLDAIRTCRAMRFRYQHADMDDLENQLKLSLAQRFRIVVTDGVFAMDGDVAPLDELCTLAAQYKALVVVNDTHGAGVLGAMGRGVIELCNVKPDLLVVDFGCVFGGTTGCCVVGSSMLVDLLRQRSRRYMFTTALSPMICGAVHAAFSIVKRADGARVSVLKTAAYCRKRLSEVGFEVLSCDSPIISIMIHDTTISQQFAEELYRRHIVVMCFCQPVVPKFQARLRIQLTAAHTHEQIEATLNEFCNVGRDLKVIK